MHQRFVLLFPGARLSKLLPALLLLLCLLSPVKAQAPAEARLVISRAVRLDLSHTGIHTHANFVLFDTGFYDLSAMQHDPIRYPHLTIRAETRLDTDHAALPPDLTMPGDPPLDNPYGPIGGGAGQVGLEHRLAVAKWAAFGKSFGPDPLRELAGASDVGSTQTLPRPAPIPAGSALGWV